MEALLAAVLAAAFVLMIAIFRQPASASTRGLRRGRKITWDQPEHANPGGQ